MSALETNNNAIESSAIESDARCRCFSLVEIQSATKNFDDALVIGTGGFGKVYKGSIHDIGTTIVAVKRLNAESKQGANEFSAEIKMLSILQHTNLVDLIGYCTDCDEKILVYGYVARGTLADHLYKRSREESSSASSSSLLSWEQRLEICIGAARGLDYIHNGASQSFIHRDVKTTNILLDENWVVKISDFGLSKGPASHSITHLTTDIKGTFGYLDPDYFLTRRLTKKSDVYAFGVVLLEVLCGRPPVDKTLEEEQIGLVDWAKQCIKKGKLDRVIDPSLSGQISPRCLNYFVKVAKNCLHKGPKARPTMAGVVESLQLALASQRNGRKEGIIAKLFQGFARALWVRERKDDDGGSTQYSQSPKPSHPPVKSTVVSQIDELEDVALDRVRSNAGECAAINSGEEVNTDSFVAGASAATMEEAIDGAEATLRHSFCSFTSGLEMASLLVSSDLLHHSWDAISKLYREETNPSDPPSRVSIRYKVYEYGPYGTVIAFVSSPPCTTRHLQGEGRDLVSSHFFDFFGTEVNPSFSIHRAAVTLFTSLQDELSSLKDLYGNSSPLIVTGHSIGGSIASLFTLWLLKSIPPVPTKRPLCITFGSPFIGNKGFQQAIFERPRWNSCFLHVASHQDPIVKLFTTKSTHRMDTYMPFGTFLLCSESGCAYFEEPELVLDFMGGKRLHKKIFFYGDVLEKLKREIICRGVSVIGEQDMNPLETGILLQLEAIKLEGTMRQEETVGINSLIEQYGKRAEDLIAQKMNVFDPRKKLIDTKMNMTYLERYKKVSVSRGGYYDVFKNEQSMSREEIVKQKNNLTLYWDKMVKEVIKMPQEEGQFFRQRWLFGGTNYRRLVEPLDIAEYYKNGKTDYLTARSEHYELLEQWLNTAKLAGNQSNGNETKRPCSLTKDSCFWAHVEEAIISCKLLKDGETCEEDEESLVEDLVDFENYVMDLVSNYEVSAEIFVKQSTFMKWWENYDKMKGTSYNSLLTDFMRNCKYEQYA